MRAVAFFLAPFAVLDGAFANCRWQGQEVEPSACHTCHTTVYDEWRDSAHARAFVDPVFQKALSTRTTPERCIPCHAPASVLDRLGQMPRARTDRREQGVDCSSCHVRSGVVHGPDGKATDAHPVTRDPAFSGRGSVALCSSCHDLRIADVLPLAREFRAAREADEGASDATCIGCHMESVRRAAANDPVAKQPVGEPRHGRSHRLLGPNDSAFCAEAFAFTVEGRGPEAALVLRNGAGHGVPGLARLRRFPVSIAWIDQDGRTVREERLTISWQDRLLVDEERRWVRPAATRAVAVRVRVDHAFSDQKPTSVLDRTLELP